MRRTMASRTAIVALAPLADGGVGHMGDWGAGWWILMVAGMVLAWGLVIFGIVWVMRESGRRGERESSDQDSLSILDRRLARGEISPEEHEDRRRILSREPRNE